VKLVVKLDVKQAVRLAVKPAVLRICGAVDARRVCRTAVAGIF
jgi:hypothetical protein